MDSLSQFALGAAVGVAVMGRRTAVWKAALWGGVCGTLPDLDALVDHGDPVLNMVLHRAHTHALFWQTLASVPVAAAIAWLQREGGFRRWWAAVWLIFVTHALLDAMTVYGTQLARPFSDHPYGVGSIFIIDPLYTLPLLLGLWVALVGRWPGRWRWNATGLALSTAYLGWSAAAQWHVEGVVREQLARRPDAPAIQRVLVTPAPLNTLLWRVVLMRPGGYEEGFYALADAGRPIRFERHATDPVLTAEALAVPAAASIAAFSQGFFRVDERDAEVRITDLRMGQEPNYVFSFAVAQRASPLQPITPRESGGRGDIDVGRALHWLWRRAGGADIDPPR